jgi:hypothetical protein
MITFCTDDISSTVRTIKRVIFGYLQSKYIISEVGINRTYDIGKFTNASKIGFGFPMTKTRKIWQARLFQSKHWFPETIIPSEFNSDDPIKLFFENKQAHSSYVIYKENFGLIGSGIYLFKNFKEYENKKLHLQRGILQYPIYPLLYKGKYKFDVRSIVLYIKQDENYFAYYFDKSDWIKISSNPYDPNSLTKSGFLTNVGYNFINHKNLNNQIKMFDKFIDENFPDKSVQMKQKYFQVMKEVTKIRLEKLKMDTEKYFKNRPVKCKNMFWISGSDIIFDHLGNPFLLEINGRPGLLEDDDHEIIYFLTVHLINDLCKYCFDPWIRGEKHCFHESHLCTLINKI